MFDPRTVRTDFPIFSREVNGKPLVYLDSAATSQKPQQVIQAIVDYYSFHNANVHRGVHTLSDESTELFEKSHATVATFLGADPEELVFTRNTTEAINGVAYGWANQALQNGDVIVSTLMEHHSDFVVWQEVCKRTGAHMKTVSVDANGRLVVEELEQLLKTNPVRLVVLPYVSNTLGTINPIKHIVQLTKAHAKESKVLIDAAQAVPHLKVNFHELGVDFLAFSGHKMLGPMGSGGLLVKRTLLEQEEVKPWLFGGGMIESVTVSETTFREDLCERFVAGTPDVASAVGLAAACQYLSQLGMDAVEDHDRTMVAYALEKLSAIPEVTVIGPTQAIDTALDRLGSVAFLYTNVHAHDVAQILDSEGVAVRSGHHCTMPLHLEHKWQATTRASFNVYTTPEDIDALVNGLAKVKKVFG